MQKILAGLAIAKVASALHPVSNDIVYSIKQRTNAWEPYELDENPLASLSSEELQGLLGTHRSSENYQIYEETYTQVGAVPTNFDGRTQWPNYIHPIRDQGGCGSCWAFGASEALSDRFAIKSKGKVNLVLSAEDLVSCDRVDGGCDGGWLNTAFDYMEKHGLVAESCFPYSAGSGRAPSCRTTCSNGQAFKKYKCKSGSVVNPRKIDSIKSELYTNGPLEGSFDVYNDFFNYKKGVYHHVSGGLAGGHAIKVLGYGQENGLDYWLCANSWGKGWGMDGFFKIKMGDSGINNDMWGCTPDVPSSLDNETENFESSE